jgi:membrane protein DedA with SNARE-associated domain
MNISTQSVLWAITLSLFLGGLGLPVPENPLLIGGGYAISQHMSPVLPSFFLWYLGIICGDLILFAAVYWLFSRPSLSGLLERLVRRDRLEKYQKVFENLGGWTLFLARFTFFIRALAYIAAGAARYPLHRFLAVDGISVAIQVLMFVGIGYFAGDKLELAKASAHQVGILLAGAILLTVLISLVATIIMKRLTEKKSSRTT